MAIAVDATSSGNNAGTGSPLVWSHTCTGSNLVLIVVVSIPRGSFGSRSCTYNGVAMTLLDGGFQLIDETYILLNPPTGAHNVSYSYGGSGDARVIGSSASYTGCDTTTQPDSSNESNTSGAGVAPLSTTTSTTVVAANCWVVGFGACRYFLNSATNMSSGRTARVTQNFDGYGNSAGTHAAGTLLYDSNGTVATGSQSVTVATNSNASELDNFFFSLKPFVPVTNNAFLSFM